VARKRTISPFNLSFLDIMFCGFGAVVLLVMLLNREMLEAREVKQNGPRQALMRTALKHQFAREDVEAMSARLAGLKQELETTITQEQSLRARLDSERGRTAANRREANQSLERLTSMVAEKDAAERARQKLEDERKADRGEARKLIGFTGDGRRQYLTGLKLGGERTLILLDSSASMLDETLVNIIRRKLGSEAERRQAPKWRRAIRSVRWLLANVQRSKQFQVYAFNTRSGPVVAGTNGQWLSANSTQALDAVVAAVEKLAPNAGTNLAKAFESIKSLRPPPDSVILLTDGLPTQGSTPTSGHSINADDRAELFEKALTRLGKSIPINTLLFPIEGDPAAAEAFWRLAILTRGSFITPSRDWP
jgi:hypothetical protein